MKERESCWLHESKSKFKENSWNIRLAEMHSTIRCFTPLELKLHFSSTQVSLCLWYNSSQFTICRLAICKWIFIVIRNICDNHVEVLIANFERKTFENSPQHFLYLSFPFLSYLLLLSRFYCCLKAPFHQKISVMCLYTSDYIFNLPPPP